MVVAAFLAKWVMSIPRKYTYRILFIPETIGSLVYLSKNMGVMKKNIIAGFNLSCLGDNRIYSYLPSRAGDTLADRAALNILSSAGNFKKYSFLDRGSDERQYNAPGVDLPVCSVMRSKYGEYPEYHTSLDGLDLISPEGLSGSYEILRECLELLEANRFYKIKCLGEPQLGKRGLYPTLSTKSSGVEVKTMMDFIAYADGAHDLIEISDIIHAPVRDLYPIIEKLTKADLLSVTDNTG
jgi:aminopeptidase-like protein